MTFGRSGSPSPFCQQGFQEAGGESHGVGVLFPLMDECCSRCQHRFQNPGRVAPT